MKKSKLLALALSITMLASVALGCASSPSSAPGSDAAVQGGSKKIGVSMATYDDKWLSYLLDEMQAYAKDFPEYEFIFVDGTNDSNVQLGQVENFISQGCAAIIVNPVETDSSGPITDIAKTANIPIVSVNRPFLNQADAISYCGGDSKQSGVLEMEFLAEKLNYKGNIAIMIGEPTQDAAIKRTEGFKEVLAKYPDMTVVLEQTANWDRTKGMNLMEDWLQTGKKIDAIAANNDEMAIGAILALQNAGIKDVFVGGIDASPDALKYLKEGTLAVTVFQDASGQAKGAVDSAVAAAKGEPCEANKMIPYELVTVDKADEYLAKWGIK